MAREVSCIPLAVIFHAAERREIDPERLMRGVPYSLAHVRRRWSWIDWTAFAQFGRNLEAIWDEEELVEIGREALRVPAGRWIAGIGRYLFALPDFYVWMTEERHGTLRLIVEDDGHGFDPEAMPTGRFGLIGMRERITMLGGTLTIESSPAGTALYAEIPLATERGSSGEPGAT